MVSLQAAVAAVALSGAGQTVLLDFYAEWCAPCRAMEPTIQALIAEGYPVEKVNVDQRRALAAEFGVASVPCYVMLVNGREVDRVVGGTTFSRLKRMCKSGPGPSSQEPSSPVLAQLTPRQSGPPVSIPPVDTRPARSPTRPWQPAPTQPPAQPPPAMVATEQRVPQNGWTPRNETPSPADGKLTAACVRLRVEDPRGHSCGSGTIIDARQRQALILTCGHIFRESQGKGRIEVDLFGPGGTERVPGRLISYNLERDVALVAIHAPGPVTTARVAPAEYQVAPGSGVISVGCNHGNPPTAEHSRVTSLNKFLGPPNLQVAGQSVEGRSGGGLFTGDGLVIGVCNAADPSDDEALYAALGAIQAELDRTGLSFVYQPPEQDPAPRQASPTPAASLAAIDPPPSMPKRMPRSPEPSPPAGPASTPASALADESGRLSASERAALDEIVEHLQGGAEVVVVVRSRRNPLAKSEVIILDQVSPHFLKQLRAEARAPEPRDLVPTLLEIPRKVQAQPGWRGGADGWRPRPIAQPAGS